MDPLLDRRTFPGPARPVGEFHEGFAGIASFSGAVVFVGWERARVTSLLPAELELVGDHARHPVAFVFGEQRRGAVMFADVTFPMGVDYGEFGIAIPFVKHRRGRYLHTYVPRMYSSYFPAVWDGYIRYGYMKDVARMSRQGSLFVMTDEAGRLLFHASVEASGDWAAGDGGGVAATAALADAFSLPIIGSKADGSLVSAYWSWDVAGATVRPCDAWASIDADLLPRLGPSSTHDLDGGSVELRDMTWRLSLPMPPRF